MSYMYQREGFKAVERTLENLSELAEIVRIKEIFLKRDEAGAHMWHVYVDYEAFEAIAGKSINKVHHSDSEEDGPLIQRISLQTSNSITLFTLYELKSYETGEEKNEQ